MKALPAMRSSAAPLARLYLLILVVGVGTLLTIVSVIAERTLEQELDRVIQAESGALQEEFADGGQARLIEILNRRVDDWGRIGAVYLLIDDRGTRLAGNLSGWPSDARRAGRWLEFDLAARERDAVVDHPVRAGVYTLGGARLLVGTDVSQRARAIETMRAAVAWGIGLTVLLAALAGWWYSRRIGARVRDMAAACERVISGELSRRLPSDGSADEFDQLSVAVNHMLDRVEHQSTVLRTTFGSAAHDLRTPLHRMRTRLEMALSTATDATRAPMLETVHDLDRIQRTLATLLQIANAESGVGEGRMQPLDMGGLAVELVELYAPAAREKQLLLSVAAPEPAVLLGSRQLLAQLLANLLENAIKYVPENGRIEVVVAQESDAVQLLVADNGPGIAAELREEALLPFRGLDNQVAPPGSGLGLSLVAAVVRLHQGRLTLEDNAPGLRVRCMFPPHS